LEMQNMIGGVPSLANQTEAGAVDTVKDADMASTLSKEFGNVGDDWISKQDMSIVEQMVQRYEVMFRGGESLWKYMKDQKKKKVYFIGIPGNNSEMVSQAVGECLGYITPPCGTYIKRRQPDREYPPIEYYLDNTDKMMKAKSRISTVDLYMDDVQAYRDLEHECLKECSEADTTYPEVYIVGEGALTRQDNIDLMKNGYVIWLDCAIDSLWTRLMDIPPSASGIVPTKFLRPRPPVWAIAEGLDGDVDDAEAKEEFTIVVKERNAIFEGLADIRLRTDVSPVGDNAYWGAEKIIKALRSLILPAEETEISEQTIEEEALATDLEKFLEGARLSKYLQPALSWCDEQGASSIQEVLDNLEDLSEAIKLKPLEVKRIQKAKSAVEIG